LRNKKKEFSKIKLKNKKIQDKKIKLNKNPRKKIKNEYSSKQLQ